MYELVELYREPQITDGKTWVEAEVAGPLSSLHMAVQIAKESLRMRDDDTRYPWIGVIETAEVDGETTGWAAGWVTPDGLYYEGDYENDERLWPKEESDG